jgi:hypothetical protein
MSDLVDKLIKEDPMFHVGGASRWNALPEILTTLAARVARGNRTVETGCGASTVIFANAGSDHTTISPDAREHELVRQYCERNGIDHTGVTFIDSSSDEVLPTLLESRVLDLAFIDGAHAFPFAILDWHYLSAHLKVGGTMVVDDIAIPAIAPLYRFMQAESWWRLDSRPDERAAMFTLVADPPPEDYTQQRFNDRFDYSFASPMTRLKLRGEATVRLARRTVGNRFPKLREVYRSRRSD